MTHTYYSRNAKQFSPEVLANTPYSAYTEEMLHSLPFEELKKVLPSAGLCSDGHLSFSNLDEMDRFYETMGKMARQRVHDMARKRREENQKKKNRKK